MAWEVYSASEQVETWIASLTDDEQDALLAAIELLQEQGPALGRPIVDRVQGSRHHKMKELRPPKLGDVVLRVLFAFDSERQAALLVGGNKAEDGQWNEWYDTWIPVADELLDQIEERLADTRPTAGKPSVKSRKRNKKGGRR